MSSYFSAGASGAAVSPIGSGPHPMRLARLRRYLTRAQWIVALSLLAAAIVLLATYAPRARFFVPGISNSSGHYEYVRVYWWFAVTAETLVASTVGLLLGRWLIQLTARLKGTRPPLLPWYDSSVAVRDIALIGFVLSCVYLAVMYFAEGQKGLTEGRIPYVGFRSDTDPEWWLNRSWLLIGLSSVVVWLMGPRLSPGVLLPSGVSRSGQRGMIAFFYGVMIAAQTARPPFPPFFAFARNIDTLLHAAPENRRDMAVLMLAVFFAALGAYLYLWCEVVQAAKRLPKPPSPILIRLGMVGASESGKTVFLVRAYTLLSAYANVNPHGLKLEPDRAFIDSPDATEFNSARRALEEGVMQPSGETKRMWPPGTVTMTRVPMAVSRAIQPVVRFDWTDLPGGAFTSDEMTYRVHFDEFIREADRFEAVVFIFNGQLLHAAKEFRDLPYADRYEHAAREILRKQRDRGSDAHPIPIAIVITQVRKVAGQKDYLTRSRLKAKVQGFMNNVWQEGHTDLGLESPPCRIFLTSAVSNAANNTDSALFNTLPPIGVPLQSEETVEPLFFLAEHALRHNVTLIESVQGWASGRPSPLQQYVTWMRHASGA